MSSVDDRQVKEVTSSANSIYYHFDSKKRALINKREEWTSFMSDLDSELGEPCFMRPQDAIYGIRK